VMESTQKKLEKLDDSIANREKVMEAKLRKTMKETTDKNGKRISKVEELVQKVQKSLSDVPKKQAELEARIE